LTLPYEFTFENGCNDARSIEIFNIFIHPCILPAKCNTLILLKIGFIKNLLETFNCLRNIRLLYFLFRHLKLF
jgi:hypothetical protein